MELTYENMKQLLVDYFDILPSIEGEQYKPRMREFLAPDYKMHRPNRIYAALEPVAAVIENREEWVSHLCGHADKYKAVVSYQPEPLGIMIDERKKMGVMKILEEFRSTAPGKKVFPDKKYFFVFFEFCVHDDKVKIKNELIISIPGYLE